MKLWQELVSTAIVGTERQNFESSVAGDDELSHILQRIESDTTETNLLKTVAVISIYLKNGIDSIPDKEELPETVPVEKRASISRASEQHLATLLAGNYPQVLPEFFQLAAKKECVLPPPFLPDILNLGNSKRELRQVILPALGVRGRWLAGCNEDWRWALSEENNTEIWENGTRSERLLALETMRRQNSDSARETLGAVWQSEAAKDRAAFLEVLRVNLAQPDEEFLNKILQTDKSIDVKRIAFNLLLEIESSQLVKDLTERAAAIFNFKPGGFLSKPKIEINLPADFENQEKDDALNNIELYLNEKELGKKAVKIAKLLSTVPPKVWEEKFSAGKEKIIDAVKRSDWEKTLLSGLKSGAAKFADKDWLLAILPHIQQNEYYLLSNQIESRWNNAQIEKLIMFLLEGKLKNDIGFQFAAQLLRRLKNVWSDDFTSKILTFLQQPLNEKASAISSGILNSAHLISPQYLNQFDEKIVSKLFDGIGRVSGNEKLIGQFVTVVQFRRQMYAAFRNEE